MVSSGVIVVKMLSSRARVVGSFRSSMIRGDRGGHQAMTVLCYACFATLKGVIVVHLTKSGSRMPELW